MKIKRPVDGLEQVKWELEMDAGLFYLEDEIEALTDIRDRITPEDCEDVHEFIDLMDYVKTKINKLTT